MTNHLKAFYRRREVAGLFTLVLLTGLPVDSMKAATITGRLTNLLLQPVGSATVTLLQVFPDLALMRVPIVSAGVAGVTQTSANGSFLFSGVPAGDYFVCPDGESQDYINPCTWEATVPTITVAATDVKDMGAVRIRPGFRLSIAFLHASGFLNLPGAPAALRDLQVGVWPPGPHFRAAHLTSTTSTGRAYQILIPFATDLKIGVHSSLLNVKDSSGAALNTLLATAAVNVPLLGSVSPLFTITGLKDLPITIYVPSTLGANSTVVREIRNGGKQ